MAVQCAARLCFSSMVDMTWRSIAAAVSVTTRSKSPICIDRLLKATCCEVERLFISILLLRHS